MSASDFTCATERPLSLRMRPDLIVQQQTFQGTRNWVIKDPLAQKYYRFEDEEFSLLKMLDGQISLREMQQRFEKQFVPQRIPTTELQQLLGMLHRCALVVSDRPGQGVTLFERGQQRQRRETWQRFANPLSIRLPGVDPDRWLTRLLPFTGWLFSQLAVAAVFLLVLCAALLIGVQFDQFQSRLPSFQDFFASPNWIWLAIALAASKIVHELGHGLACKRFGGECHEMGVMLLIMTPCLYCNVSDAWMIPDKWRRAAVAAAGIYFELILASLATLTWWATEPGLIHYLSLSLMFVCSVSTLIFNANPLLKYDGYYILADLMEIPNLRQKAEMLLRGWLMRTVLGLPSSPATLMPRGRRWFLSSYAVAAAVYRWVITGSVLWFLYHVFRPYGLQVVGQMLILASFSALLVQPVWNLAQFLHVPGRMNRVNKPRVILTCTLVAGLIAAICFVPLPHSIHCDLYLRPRNAATVYVETPGMLKAIHVQPGDWVGADQPLVSLDNVQVRLELVRLTAQQDQLRTRYRSLLQRSFDDEAAAAQVAEAEQALTALNDQIARKQRAAERLVLAAPVQGCVIATPRVPTQDRAATELANWHGTPLDPHNLQAYLDEGVPICIIGHPQQLEAVLAIDQGDLEFVQSGQSVELLLEPLPGRRFRSELEQLSQTDMKVAPTSLSSKAGGRIVTRTAADGQEQPYRTTYQGSAPIDDPAGMLYVGATGQARIHTGYQTLARRAWRYLLQTFNLDV